MKKIMMITVFMLLITNHVQGEQLYSDELLDVTSIVIDSDLQVDSWEVVIKEKMDKKQLEQVMERLKNSYLVTIQEQENSIKYSFEDVHKNEQLNERYIAILPTDDSHQAELVAVLDGDHWNEEVKAMYQDVIQTTKTTYFTNSAQIYACLSTTDSAIINSDYFLSKLQEKLNIQHINEQYDNVLEHRKIVYGYTEQWSQKMNIMDNPINVQIVVDQTDENETYTIGTPILINEY